MMNLVSYDPVAAKDSPAGKGKQALQARSDKRKL
jgi:hypothetical protein